MDFSSLLSNNPDSIRFLVKKKATFIYYSLNIQ